MLKKKSNQATGLRTSSIETQIPRLRVTTKKTNNKRSAYPSINLNHARKGTMLLASCTVDPPRSWPGEPYDIVHSASEFRREEHATNSDDPPASTQLSAIGHAFLPASSSSCAVLFLPWSSLVRLPINERRRCW